MSSRNFLWNLLGQNDRDINPWYTIRPADIDRAIEEFIRKDFIKGLRLNSNGNRNREHNNSSDEAEELYA
jgi:hypothetical protein